MKAGVEQWSCVQQCGGGVVLYLTLLLVSTSVMMQLSQEDKDKGKELSVYQSIPLMCLT